jgi:rhodanese-related sulfurtransferase
MEIIRPRFARREPRAWLAVIMTALIVLVAGFGFSRMRALQWFWLKTSLRTHFPRVRWITTQELADWPADQRLEQPVLLDVRSVDEWAVSHLPGARRVEPKASVEAALGGVARDTPIVTYCAIGYRSAEMAMRLHDAGFTKVQNLDGSIFQWANEHRPLVRDGALVKQVHPYNAFRGRLLDEDVRAPIKE